MSAALESIFSVSAYYELGSVQDQPPTLPSGNLQSPGDDDTDTKKIKWDTEHQVLSTRQASIKCSVHRVIIYRCAFIPLCRLTSCVRKYGLDVNNTRLLFHCVMVLSRSWLQNIKPACVYLQLCAAHRQKRCEWKNRLLNKNTMPARSRVQVTKELRVMDSRKAACGNERAHTPYLKPQSAKGFLSRAPSNRNGLPGARHLGVPWGGH